MAQLDRYLEQLETQVQARGGTVHWAADATEANEIVTGLAAAAGAREVVKVKSMVTDEIGLNEALAASGITAHETDLAELIVQLGHDRPSHILVPAIHRNRPGSASAAPTSLSRKPARCAWWSRRATAGCASPCRTR
jgi:L-lactate dehydrogenase complex protein LldF